MDTHGIYDFRVRTYECGKNGRITLPSLCNYLQEAAAINAEELTFSKSDFEAAGENISWVLTRLRVKITEFPKWEETVRVLTFPRGGRRITAWRDFILTDPAGRHFGVAASEWMIIDLATRKIMPIPDAVFAVANTVRPPVLGEEPFTPRLRFPHASVCPPSAGDSCPPSGDRPRKEFEKLVFRAQNSHIDLNGHVNNVHYIAWLLEACPHREVTDLEIVFRSETFAGEDVAVEIAAGENPGETFHRVADLNGKDHVVAVSREA